MLEVLATADDLDHTDIAQQQSDTESKEQTKNAANFVFLLHRQESTHYASPPPPHAACYNRSLAAAAIIIMVHMAIITFALRRTGLQVKKDNDEERACILRISSNRRPNCKGLGLIFLFF